jgi:hypothetical protein
MKPPLSWRMRLGILLVAAMGLIGGIKPLIFISSDVELDTVLRTGRLPRNDISRLEDSMRCVRKYLRTEDIKQVGFAGPKHIDGLLRQMQYVLAPVIVADTVYQDILVGYFRGPNPVKQAEQTGFKVVLICKGGAILLKGLPAP